MAATYNQKLTVIGPPRTFCAKHIRSISRPRGWKRRSVVVLHGVFCGVSVASSGEHKGTPTCAVKTVPGIRRSVSFRKDQRSCWGLNSVHFKHSRPFQRTVNEKAPSRHALAARRPWCSRPWSNHWVDICVPIPVRSFRTTDGPLDKHEMISSLTNNLIVLTSSRGQFKVTMWKWRKKKTGWDKCHLEGKVLPLVRFLKTKYKPEIWPQRPRYFVAAIAIHYRRGGWGLTLVLTLLGWCLARVVSLGGGGGVKRKVSSSLNHGLLQNYFTPFSKAAKQKVSFVGPSHSLPAVLSFCLELQSWRGLSDRQSICEGHAETKVLFELKGLPHKQNSGFRLLWPHTRCIWMDSSVRAEM